jgi:hypothetical protein
MVYICSPSDGVFMKWWMVQGTYMEQWWGPSVLHFPKGSHLTEVNASVREEKNLHTDVTGSQTQNAHSESPVSYPRPTQLSENVE